MTACIFNLPPLPCSREALNAHKSADYGRNGTAPAVRFHVAESAAGRLRGDRNGQAYGMAAAADVLWRAGQFI